MKNKILKFGLMAFLWAIITLPALAGPIDPPGEEDPPYEDPTPIDNWMLLLILAGVALGAYFLMKYRRKAIV